MFFSIAIYRARERAGTSRAKSPPFPFPWAEAVQYAFCLVGAQGGSINEGSPIAGSWLVYFMDNPWQSYESMDDLGVPPISGNLRDVKLFMVLIGKYTLACSHFQLSTCFWLTHVIVNSQQSTTDSGRSIIWIIQTNKSKDNLNISNGRENSTEISQISDG
jgi:hypothetical protein